MSVVDIPREQSHSNNLKEEIHGGDVEQTEQEEPGLTEVKGEQAIPFHQRQGMAMELLAETED